MPRQGANQQTRKPEQAGHRALRKGRASLPWQVYLVTTATHERRPVFLDFLPGARWGTAVKILSCSVTRECLPGC